MICRDLVLEYGDRATVLPDYTGIVLQLQAASYSANAWFWLSLWCVHLILNHCGVVWVLIFDTNVPRELSRNFPFLNFLGRETPSVAGIINPGSEGFQKLFFGQQEIAIPVNSTYVPLLSLSTCSIFFGYSLFAFSPFGFYKFLKFDYYLQHWSSLCCPPYCWCFYQLCIIQKVGLQTWNLESDCSFFFGTPK